VHEILLTLRSDIPRATEYLLAERLVLLTASLFCGDRTVRTLPGGLLFSAEALILNVSTRNCMSMSMSL
jgi:hypothetical protein